MVSRWWDPGIGERDRIGVGSHHDKDQGVFNGGNPSKLGDLDWKLGKGSFMIRGRIGSKGDRISISSVFMKTSDGYQGILVVIFGCLKVKGGMFRFGNWGLREVRYGDDLNNQSLQIRSGLDLVSDDIFLIRLGISVDSSSDCVKDFVVYYTRASGKSFLCISKVLSLLKHTCKKGSNFLCFTMTQGHLMGTMGDKRNGESTRKRWFSKQVWESVLGSFKFSISSMSICFSVGLQGVFILISIVEASFGFMGILYARASIWNGFGIFSFWNWFGSGFVGILFGWLVSVQMIIYGGSGIPVQVQKDGYQGFCGHQWFCGYWIRGVLYSHRQITIRERKLILIKLGNEFCLGFFVLIKERNCGDYFCTSVILFIQVVRIPFNIRNGILWFKYGDVVIIRNLYLDCLMGLNFGDSIFWDHQLYEQYKYIRTLDNILWTKETGRGKSIYRNWKWNKRGYVGSWYSVWHETRTWFSLYSVCLHLGACHGIIILVIMEQTLWLAPLNQPQEEETWYMEKQKVCYEILFWVYGEKENFMTSDQLRCGDIEDLVRNVCHFYYQGAWFITERGHKELVCLMDGWILRASSCL